MDKSLNYFFADVVEAQEEEIEIMASDRFKDENGNVILWKFRLFSADEIADMKKKSTNLVKKGGTKQVTIDSTLLTQNAILESVTYPNLKDVQLQESYKVLSDRQLLKKMLTGPELERLGDKVLRVQGFLEDINALIDDAKN